MNEQIYQLAAEFIYELSKATPEDYFQWKLMLLSITQHPELKVFLNRVFSIAEERRPLLLTAR